MKDTHEFNIWDLLSQNLEKKKYHPHTPAKVMKVAKREQIQLEKSGEKM